MRPGPVVVLLGVASLASPAAAQLRTTEMVAMTDGTHLATDVYRPDAATGPLPALLARTPYDKNGLRAFAEMAVGGVNVAVVAQDTRGRYASEGTDCIFRCELQDGFSDGADTIAWIRAQPWSNGVVVTWGGSALGIIQYMQAAAAPEGLAAMSATVATPMVYDHAFFPGGCFRQSLVEGWLDGIGSTFFLDDVRAHTLLDSFWDPVQTQRLYDRVQVPTLHWGGWYDIFSQGTLDAFVGYQHGGGDGARGRQKLVMGPWTHGGESGDLTYPDNARAPPIADMEIKWLLHQLGIAPDPAIDAWPAVTYYVMGDVDDPAAPGNEWRTADDWPIPAAPVRLYLQADGALAELCPDGGLTSWSYDPTDPSPTVGGANLVLPAGPMDQRAVEARDDVTVFETPELTAPMEITGRVRAHLFVQTDTVDTDVMVRLTDVYPDGRSMLVLDGGARLATRHGTDHLDPVTPGDVVELDVDLWSTSIVLPPGHRLRISLTSSNAPRFWPNPNDGSSYGGSGSPVVAHVSVLHSREGPSYLEVPEPHREPGSVVVCRPVSADAGIIGGEPAGDEAGIRDGGAPDGGSGGGGGCACRTAGHGSGGAAMLLLIGVLLAARRRVASR